jgi:outer membrane protein OmpA-like peptidoglycan-associated protein
LKRLFFLFLIPILATVCVAHADDIRQQMGYTFKIDETHVEKRDTFVIQGAPSIPPLAVAVRNPPLSAKVTREAPAATTAEARPVHSQPRAVPPKKAEITIQFGLNSATLTAGEKEKLSAFAGNMKAGTKARIEVHGYTCDLGPAAFNERLAHKRARTVASFLHARGITPTTVTGSGTCCYITNDRRLRSLNRRVHITLTGEDR